MYKGQGRPGTVFIVEELRERHCELRSWEQGGEKESWTHEGEVGEGGATSLLALQTL